MGKLHLQSSEFVADRCLLSHPNISNKANSPTFEVNSSLFVVFIFSTFSSLSPRHSQAFQSPSSVTRSYRMSLATEVEDDDYSTGEPPFSPSPPRSAFSDAFRTPQDLLRVLRQLPICSLYLPQERRRLYNLLSQTLWRVSQQGNRLEFHTDHGDSG
jgi:hypothetical protein